MIGFDGWPKSVGGVRTLVFIFVMVTLPLSAHGEIMGSLDIYLEVPGGLFPTPGLAGYDVRLDLTPSDLGVNLVNAVQTDNSGPYPPIFPAGSPFVFGGGDMISVTDFLFVPPSVPIQDEYGLFRLLFSIAPNTLGTFAVAINEVWTGLSDADGNPIEYIATDGEIEVSSGGVVAVTPGYLTIVPEPISLAMLGVGGLLVLRRRKR